jgi:hypothetical protein
MRGKWRELVYIDLLAGPVSASTVEAAKNSMAHH